MGAGKSTFNLKVGLPAHKNPDNIRFTAEQEIRQQSGSGKLPSRVNCETHAGLENLIEASEEQKQYLQFLCIKLQSKVGVPRSQKVAACW